MCLLTRTEECARHPVHGELDTGERILRCSIRTWNCREESLLTYMLRALRRVVVAQSVGVWSAKAANRVHLTPRQPLSCTEAVSGLDIFF